MQVLCKVAVDDHVDFLLPFGLCDGSARKNGEPSDGRVFDAAFDDGGTTQSGGTSENDMHGQRQIVQYVKFIE